MLSNLATNAVFGGTATVAFAGLAELLGPWVLPWLACLAVSSPPAIRAYGRWLARVGTGPHPATVGSPTDTEHGHGWLLSDAEAIDWDRLIHGQDKS